jgi:hypothetical protein
MKKKKVKNLQRIKKINNKTLFFNKKAPYPTSSPPFMSKKPQKITNMKIKKVKKYKPRPSPPLLHQQLEP